MSENEGQRPSYDALQQITDSFYYTYLYFEGTELVASITNDDYCAWIDHRTNVWASGLWDVDEVADDATEFDYKRYLEGEDHPFPDTIYDGSPHPKAGEMQHWDGMDAWYTTLITNNVLAAEHWAKELGLDMNKWKFVELTDEDTTLESIRHNIATEYATRYDKEVVGDDYEPDVHVEAAIQKMREAGVWPSDVVIPV